MKLCTRTFLMGCTDSLLLLTCAHFLYHKQSEYLPQHSMTAAVT